MLRRNSSSLLEIYTPSIDMEDQEPRRASGSFIKRMKKMLLRHSHSTSSLTSLDTYTYVDQNSRMLHHSHGVDGSIIDMF